MTDTADMRTTDAEAIDAIARMLRDPEWGVGMLEDIADLVSATGRSIQGTCGGCDHPADGVLDERCQFDGCPCHEHGQRPTWDRH